MASGLLAGLIKPPLQYPKSWGLGRMAEQGGRGGVKGHRIAMLGMGPMHRGERASERLLSRKECDIARGTNELGPAEGGSPRDPSGYGKNTTEWGVLMVRRPQWKEYIGTREENDLARGVHEHEPEPETGEGGTCQERGTVRLCEGLQREDASGHRKKVSEGCSRAREQQCESLLNQELLRQ